MSRELGNSRKLSSVAGALLLLTLLSLSGCASGTLVTEVPFGSEAEVGPLVVSTAWTGEGEFLLVLSSTAPEDLDVDVRMRRTEIGFDYGRNASKIDPKFYSQFKIEKARRPIRSGEVHEFPVRLDNPHQVSRYFYTIVYVNVKGVDARWKFEIRLEDNQLFTDVKYLRQLNKTDYWHPRIIRENWEKYLTHIGE